VSPSKQLFVLRHAKSSWDDPELEDRERPLAPRGWRTTKVMGEHIRAAGVQPAQVVCSSALRAKQTLEGVAPGGEHLIEPELYCASAREVIERLRRVPDELPSVMVIGHNPTTQELVLELADAGTGSAEETELAQIPRKFPTGALATLTFECGWSELTPQCARLVAFVRPKQLSR
jgi:phosphohistidine phosphatase